MFCTQGFSAAWLEAQGEHPPCGGGGGWCLPARSSASQPARWGRAASDVCWSLRMSRRRSFSFMFFCEAGGARGRSGSVPECFRVIRAGPSHPYNIRAVASWSPPNVTLSSSPKVRRHPSPRSLCPWPSSQNKGHPRAFYQ